MLKEIHVSVPEFEIVKTNEDGTVLLRYTNTNRYTKDEIVEVDRLSDWINRELITAWRGGYQSAKHEIREALGVKQFG